MSQRDTFLPVCKLFDVTDTSVGDITLTRTAQFLESVTISDASGWPEGTTNISVSGGGAGTGGEVLTSAVISVIASKDSTDLIVSSSKDATAGGGLLPYPIGQPALTVTTAVKTPGAYAGTLSSLGVSGQTPLNPVDADHLNASGVFTLTMVPAAGTVPYVTVTDLSGTDGYFRVFPSSGAGFYTSGSASSVLAGSTGSDVSGYAGIIGAPGTTVVLTLQPAQAVNTIHIENRLNVDAKFAVNYGVIKQANTIRDQQFPEVK